MSDAPYDDDRTPRPLWHAFWRRKGIVAACLLIATALGVLNYFKLPGIYESSALVLVRRPPHNVDKEGKTPPPAVQVVAGILAEPKTSELAANSELRWQPGFQRDDLAKFIAAGLGARELLETPDVVQATFRCPSAPQSRKVLEAVLATRPEFVTQPGAGSKSDIAALLEEVNRLKHRLTQLEAEGLEFAKAAPEGWLGPDTEARQREATAELEKNIDDIVIERLELQALKAPIDAALAEGDRDKALELVKALKAAPTLPEPKPLEFEPAPAPKPTTGDAAPGSLEALRIEESKLLQSYGENHPKVREIRARIEAVQRSGSSETTESRLLAEEKLLLETLGAEHPKVRAIRAQLEVLRGGKTEVVDGMVRRRPAAAATSSGNGDPVTAALDRLMNDINQRSSREQDLKQKLAEQEARISKFADYASREAKQRKDTLALRAQREATIERLRAAVESAFLTGTEVVVVSQPTTGVLVEPVLRNVMTPWLAVGLVAGLGLAMAVEAATRRSRTPEQLEPVAQAHE